MKKILSILLMIYCLFITNVYAIEIGGSSNSENYEGILSTETNQKYNVKSGSKHTIAVTYDSYWDNNDTDISRIEVNINASGINISSSSNMLGDGISLTGSGSNYTINMSENAEIDGAGLFILTFPSLQSSNEYNVTATAKSYNKAGSLKETKSVNIKYIVLVKSTTCDDNNDVSVSANTGGFEKSNSFFADTYTQTTESSSINLSIIPNSSKTKIAYIGDSFSFSSDSSLQYNSSINLNNQSLNYGENNFAFTVSSECATQSDDLRQKTLGGLIIGGTDWYNEVFYSSSLLAVVVNRPDNRSNVNSLKSLSISNVSINFKSELKNYLATVPYNISSVKINSELTDPKSSYVNGYGNRTVNLNEGSNDVLVKVRAENGNETTYTVKITREKNNDSTLKSIKVDDNDILVKEGTLRYSLKVDNNITKPTITAIANDPNAKIEIDNIEELKEGDNDINIIVTASNGMKSNYVVNIIRDKLISTNSKLKKITIKNHDFIFDSETLNYKIKLTNDEDKLDIDVETANLKATYLITGNKDLKNKSVIKIKVTAEDEQTTTTYNIEIEKETQKNKFGIFLVIIILIIGIVFFIVVIRMNKKNKKNLNNNQINAEDSSNNQVNTEDSSVNGIDNLSSNEENINFNSNDIELKKKDN